jgi:transposase
MMEETVMGSKRDGRHLEIVHPNCAGIDVGKDRHYVAVNPAKSDTPVRSFQSFTDDLQAMASWLQSCGVTVVAMEATGVYWISLFEVLDRAGFECLLVDPRATKQVSGRKSDVLDCQWIWQLTSYGLLRGAFRPPDAICELRSYVRQRRRAKVDAGRAVQHMQKALTQMNIRLDSVLSSIVGKTGQLIIRAIVAGERDGRVLARFRDRRVKADEATLARSLTGTWRAEHLFELTQALERFDLHQSQIERLESRIGNAITLLTLSDTAFTDRRRHDAETDAGRSCGSINSGSDHSALRELLSQQLGVDLTRIPCIGLEAALTIASEIGPDVSRFPTVKHFCSWLNLAPPTRISGDRKLSSRAPLRANPVGQMLRQAATTARKDKGVIGAGHRRRLIRLGKQAAIKATAHQLARLIYAMLSRGEDYVDRGLEAYEQERRDHQYRHLERRARALGMTLAPAGSANECALALA